MNKIIITFSLLLTFIISHAQTYSGWITADKNQTLKVRWATKKDAKNDSYLLLQFISSVWLQNERNGHIMRQRP
jgi:hypothetical protein